MGRDGLRRVLVASAVLATLPAVPAAAAPAPVPAGTAVVDSALLGLAARQAAGRGVPPGPTPDGIQTRAGRVLVELQVDGPAAAAAQALQTVGLQVTHALPAAPFDIVEGWIDPARVDEAVALSAARAVDVARAAVTDFGAVTTEGDALHRAPGVRALGTTGAGQKVGIISDSFDWQTTNPTFAGPEFGTPVNVFIDDEPEGTDEGRAMAEIVQDLAPGAALSFASGTTAAGKAAAIDRLRTEGMTVIADDLAALSQPFFQDHVVATAANNARAAGIAYFASAGNRGRQSWEGTFTNSGGFHNFLAGGTDTIQSVATVAAGGTATLYLQWAEPWGRVATDFDALLVRSDGAALTGVSGGTTRQVVGTGNPAEVVSWTNTTGAPVTIGLRIQRFAGTATPLLKWIYNGSGGAAAPLEYATGSDAINPDAASATGVLAVAAVNEDDPGLDTPEDFSSRGPKIRLFPAGAPAGTLPSPVVRAKPNLAAADCVANTVNTARNNFSDGTGFCGTSAAAPHAAAIAALLRSASPSMDVTDVYRIMQDPANAIACTSTRPADDCGSGFVLADKVLGALDTTPPTVTSTISPAVPDGTNGWYRATPTVTFAVADAQSTIVSQSGCGAVPIPGNGTITVQCRAVSGGGTTEVPVTVKHDGVPPAPPSIVGLTPGASYPQNELPKGVTCTSADDTSGLAGCALSGPLPTTRGLQSIGMTATDGAGNTASRSVSFRVAAPIDRIRTPLTKALFKKRPTVLALTGRGFRLTATGVPNGTLTVTVKRGVVTIARGVAKARNGIVTVTVRASNPVLRKQTRRSRGKKVVVSARFLATSGSTRRSSVTRPIAKLG